ncbi:peptidylprolyl isomerase [Pseudoalteromonas nigrifaciens]|uniref:peptidylprolyl isomerase n=1 Tax=Pseudoalteromonas nigrifaciens TaxID=28109 RepID=UPI001867EC88|nr:peptidylprolyl isomerase [Pseudoalteromonas nigrifaciens]
MKKLLLASLLSAVSFASSATIVEIKTSQGIIKVNLFDQQTPKTVANFLSYVGDAAYNQTVIHRSVKDFIIQGGGFTYSDGFDRITTKPAVINEPIYSNVKGTIAMAKLGGNPNSATSQWFFNLKDNSAGNPKLDTQNGGFTVFGQIMDDSQATLDKIAALVHCEEVPVVGITKDQCATISNVNLVSIDNMYVLDDDPNTAHDLLPVENTLIGKMSNDSSGSMAWLLGALLLVLPRLKRAK